MNGLEVLPRIKPDLCTQLFPIVMPISLQEEHGIVESYQLSVNSYIVRQPGLYGLLRNQAPARPTVISKGESMR